MKIRTLYFLISILILASCSKNDYLAGFDKQELFASPTQDELNDVKADWQSRNLSPEDYHVEQAFDVVGNGTVLKIVSFKVSGYKEYGALLLPPSNVSMPLHMYIGGFGIDVTENSIALVSDTSADDTFAFAIPALRGQSLSITIDGAEYTTPVSEGPHCDAFDGATDDAIAFLNIIESTETNVNVNRTAMRGGSRGGAVALLAGERDKRVKISIGVAGPTDMIELTSKNENDPTYQCQFLDALVNNTSGISETRHKMIASSPVFFAADLPTTQVHFAEDDIIVPVSQGDELKTAVDESGNQNLFEMYVYEGRDHYNIATDNQLLEDIIKELMTEL